MKALLSPRLVAAVAAVAGMTAVATPAAQAGLLVQTAQGCTTQQLSKPFARFGDFADYTPMPGGSFEAGAPAWTMTGGARVVSGNESYNVRSTSDTGSLYLPQGASA